MTHPDALERLPLLEGRAWSAEELAGGLSNSTLRVRTTDGRGPVLDLVVRHWGPGGEVDHDVEHSAALAAQRAGVGPAVVAYLPADRILVTEHLAGRVLTADEVRLPATLVRIAATLRAWHAGAPLGHDLGLIATARRYPRLTDAPALARIERALAAQPEPQVPCHNDLVPANIVDDGERIRLIDFEYAGDAESSAELGGLAAGADLAEDEVEVLVAAYDGTASPRRIARVRLWQLVDRLLWSEWADAAGHGEWAEHLRGLAGAMSSDALDRLLDVVAGT